MGIKSSKPTSPGRRFQTTSTFEDITRSKPEKSLLMPLNRKGGRNSNGRMTSRHRGGGGTKGPIGSSISNGIKMVFRPRWLSSNMIPIDPPILRFYIMWMGKSGISFPLGISPWVTR